MPQSPPCIAIVDDDNLVRTFFEAVLVEDGYRCRTFSRCSDALADFAGSLEPPDLILSDILMDGMTGLEFLRALHNADCRIPVILISGYYDLPCAMEAIGCGASDYLLKPALPNDILAAVDKHLNPPAAGSRVLLPTEADFSADLRNLAGRTEGRRLTDLVTSMAEKRIETLEHSRRVTEYALLTARRIAGRTGDMDWQDMEIGAMLHDLGKVGVPENVINKAGPLNPDEWRIMKLHPAIGRDLLKAIPDMDGVAEIVYSHHENFDGTGYPRGLSAGEINRCARIFSVVDAFDAITSDRPYRPAQTVSAAMEEIRRMAGSQFDPAIVEEFLRIPEREFEIIRRVHSEPYSPT